MSKNLFLKWPAATMKPLGFWHVNNNVNYEIIYVFFCPLQSCSPKCAKKWLLKSDIEVEGKL